MIKKFNILQYSNMQKERISEDLSLSILNTNLEYKALEKRFLEKYDFEKLNSFSFCKDGFFSLLLNLSKKGKIAISIGETQSLIDAAKKAEDFGVKIAYINLQKDGNINYEEIKNLEIDFLFISSYIMDTFVKIDLEKVKTLTKAKIISNASANFSALSDVIYFDPYKLTGFSFHGLILYNDEFLEEQKIAFKDTIALDFISQSLENQKFNYEMKALFEKKLKETFKDDIYFFVDNTFTLEYSLHIGLKNIKARELIRTLALDSIHITNGEGCSLGLSKPSRIIQAMGYDELSSRNSISFTFTQGYSEEEIDKIVSKIAKKYRQIKVLNQGNN